MKNLVCWQSSPEALPRLTNIEVHVWRAHMLSANDVRLEDLLSADEKARADAYYFPADRARFVLGRGMLRTLLGHYTDHSAASLAFQYRPSGKPSLKPSEAGRAIEFNVSHSGNWVLCAIGLGRMVGIDVERVRAISENLQIARTYFSRGEADAL